MTKMKIGEPYNVLFSNKHLATKYLHHEMKDSMFLDGLERNEVMKNSKQCSTKKTFKKRLKTIFVYAGSCIVLVSYFSLMIIGGIVCILVL